MVICSTSATRSLEDALRTTTSCPIPPTLLLFGRYTSGSKHSGLHDAAYVPVVAYKKSKSNFHLPSISFMELGFALPAWQEKVISPVKPKYVWMSVTTVKAKTAVLLKQCFGVLCDAATSRQRGVVAPRRLPCRMKHVLKQSHSQVFSTLLWILDGAVGLHVLAWVAPQQRSEPTSVANTCTPS